MDKYDTEISKFLNVKTGLWIYEYTLCLFTLNIFLKSHFIVRYRVYLYMYISLKQTNVLPSGLVLCLIWQESLSIMLNFEAAAVHGKIQREN